MLNIGFNHFTYAQTIFPLELTNNLILESNRHTPVQGAIDAISTSVPNFTNVYSSMQHLFGTYIVQDLKTIKTSFSDALIPSPANVKSFVAIMRTNPDIQRDLLKIYTKYLGNEDKALSHPNQSNLLYTMRLPGEHGVQYFSLEKIRDNVALLRARGIEIISYDLEKHLSPANDLVSPLASVKAASEVVHQNKMKLMISPSRELTSLYGAQFAKYADIYNIQAQSLQSTPTVYKNYVEQIVKDLRSDNPAIFISSQVSTARGSLNSMKNSISSVIDSVDGVTSWYSADDKGLDKLERFVKWFSKKYG
jgi:hypothetical protein